MLEPRLDELDDEELAKEALFEIENYPDEVKQWFENAVSAWLGPNDRSLVSPRIIINGVIEQLTGFALLYSGVDHQLAKALRTHYERVQIGATDAI